MAGFGVYGKVSFTDNIFLSVILHFSRIRWVVVCFVDVVQVMQWSEVVDIVFSSETYRKYMVDFPAEGILHAEFIAHD